MLLASSLLVLPVKDTVWWNTPGGRVTEHRDETGASCSLMLYDDAGSVVFQFADRDMTLVTATDRDWAFPNNAGLPVAMRLGDVWLSNGGGSAIIDGVGHGNAVGFAVTQPVQELLRPADHLEVRTTVSSLLIQLNNAKLSALLSRVQQCRDAVAHILG